MQSLGSVRFSLIVFILTNELRVSFLLHGDMKFFTLYYVYHMCVMSIYPLAVIWHLVDCSTPLPYCYALSFH